MSKRPEARRFPAIALCALALVLVASVPGGARAADPSDEVWAGFRAAFPNHIQTIAVSDVHADGSRTLILSEPPPHVTLASIRAVDRALLGEARTKKNPLGYDGLVKDVVVRLRVGDAELGRLIGRLSTHLFHTSYKAHALRLPYRRGEPAERLDLVISTEDLRAWLDEPERRFLPVLGGPETDLRGICAETASLVFQSAEPGLVLWWIPKGTRLEDDRAVIRQFTLDSDLIVGARIFDEGLLIVGRERVAPLDVVPPLRVETVLLLAAVQDDELAQSYERNHILAGRYKPGGDWAPIFLSPELRDSEYGSLLNIADQMLKGWSNRGMTRYVNFKYPDPPGWPFPEPAPRFLQVDQLTYNWNTSGAGYSVRTEQIETYALNRTGALPVSYIPGADQAALAAPGSADMRRLREAEERAYEYYSTLEDPVLARVVQYAALYQVFQRSPFRFADPPEAAPQPEVHLTEMMVGLLRQLGESDLEGLQGLADGLSQMVGNLRGRPLEADERSAVRSFVAALHREVEGESDANLESLLEVLEIPTELLPQVFRESGPEFLDQVAQLQYAAQIVLPAMAASQDLHRRYAEWVISSRQTGWIRTPAIVLSSVHGTIRNAVGGHNLDSRISPFRFSRDVPVGQVRVREIDGETVVVLNPADSASISKVVRTAGMSLGDPKVAARRLGEALPKVEPRPARPWSQRHAALGMPPPPPKGPPPPRGAAFAAEPAGGGYGRFGSGWGPSGRGPSRPMLADFRKVRESKRDSILVERLEDGTFRVMHSEKDRPLEAYTPEDAIDLLVHLVRTAPGSSEPLQVHLAGLTRGEAEGFVQSARVREAAARRARRVQGIVRPRATSIRELGGRLARGYDFKSAVLTEARELADARGLQFTFDVAPRPERLDLAPGRLRSRVQFVKAVAADVLARAKAKTIDRLKAILTRSRDPELEPFQILDDIDAELRALERETGVAIESLENKFESNMGEIFVTRKEPAELPRAGRPS